MVRTCEGTGEITTITIPNTNLLKKDFFRGARNAGSRLRYEAPYLKNRCLAHTFGVSTTRQESPVFVSRIATH